RPNAHITASGLLTGRSLRGQYAHALLDLWPIGGARTAQVMISLQVHPQLRRCAKIFCEPQRYRGRNRGAAMHDVVDAGWIDVEIAREAVLADAVRLHEFLGEDLAGRNRRKLFQGRHGRCSSMIVNDFNVLSATVTPTKANPPLVVDAD